MTDAEIDQVPDGLHRVGPNLFIQVRGASGSWMVSWYERSRVTTMNLGSCRDVSLDRARRHRDLALALVGVGVDPRDARNVMDPQQCRQWLSASGCRVGHARGGQVDTSDLIALAALIVAILALPVSYFVAIRQVKVGLNEAERRSKRKARLLVADRLDEFYKVFYSAVTQFTVIKQDELQRRLKEIDPHIREIDDFVRNSGILDRLALAIDLAATEFADLPQSSDLLSKLQSIRGQIALGSDATRYATLGVIGACGGVDLQSALRKA
jgi:hypothetical protein